MICRVFFWLCLLTLSNHALLAQVIISGLVLDQQQRPIPDVYVQLIEKEVSSVTDKQGNFAIQIDPGNYQITFKHLSFADTTLTIEAGLNINLIIQLSETTQILQAIEVVHHWAYENTPVTHQEIKQSELEQKNLGQDLPYLLRRTPSLVVTSDAGHGIGYTGMRIRGTDPTRINVTINGVPVNDSESQGVFWVDLPDIGSSTGSIQIQRGVGSSTNGTGAFGATINLNTQTVDSEPSGSMSTGFGSYKSQKYNLRLSSGLIKNKFAIQGRLSKIKSDGYIDRARSDLNSYFLSGILMSPRSSLRMNIFSGHEETYQAWNGVPAQYVDDRALRTTNTAGNERPGSPHPQEVDNYRQTHYQLIYNQDISENGSLQATLHYTKGKGYFEQFKGSQQLHDYNFPCANNSETDLIRRRWLDNDFFGMLTSYKLRGNRFEWTSGISANQYLGGHYGEVIWAQTFCDTNLDQRYYDNDATKNDMSAYSKLHYNLTKRFVGYIDLQLRHIDYSFLGINQDGIPLNQKVNHQFFNPKIGLLYNQRNNQQYYLSMAVAHREPNRDDYTEGIPGSWPQSERLINTEIGWKKNAENWALSINGYHMYYQDQLVLTGEINDVGAYIRTNVDQSYRLGIETQIDYELSKKIRLSGNLTASKNKIKKFTEFIDDWDDGSQKIQHHRNTDLAFSPQWVGHSEIDYVFWGSHQSSKRASLTWESSWVDRQFLDNTSNTLASIPAYWIHDLGLNFQFQSKWAKQISLTLQVNNIFDRFYSSNGWVYRFNSDDYNPVADDPHAVSESNGNYHLAGLYTQATRHFMTGILVSF